MEFDLVNDWKQKEVDSILKGAEEYKNKLNELSSIENKYKEDLELAKQEYKEQYNESPVLLKIKNGYYQKGYENKNLNKLYCLKEKAHDEYWKYRYSNKLYMEYAWNTDRLKEKAIKLIDKHFITLQNKVEKKIGKIIKIKHIYGDDYLFQGEEANCKVEVITAGGYNIQRLHTRWIVKDIWKAE